MSQEPTSDRAARLKRQVEEVIDSLPAESLGTVEHLVEQLKSINGSMQSRQTDVGDEVEIVEYTSGMSSMPGDDANQLRQEFREELAAIRAELREDFKSLRTELVDAIHASQALLLREIDRTNKDLAEFRAETRAEFASLRADHAQLKNDSTRHTVEIAEIKTRITTTTAILGGLITLASVVVGAIAAFS